MSADTCPADGACDDATGRPPVSDASSAANSRGLPRAVYVLGFGIFAQGTSELMIAGLLPQMSADLGVSVGQVGFLVSGFALGMLVGAPILAAVTSRWPRKAALVGCVVLFAGMHVVGALTSSYALLFASRVMSAFVYAGFWALAGSTAAGLAGPSKRGEAMGVVAGGLTLATLLGLPAGTFLAEHAGWRSAFWAVAALSAIGAIAVASGIPSSVAAEPPAVRAELRAVRRPRLWLNYLLTATIIAALMVQFSYLAPYLLEVTGVAAASVTFYLFAYGVGAVVGIAVGGRIADRVPMLTLGVGAVGLVVVALLFTALGRHSPAAAVLAVALGLAGFVVNPVLNSRVFGLAPGAPTFAPAFAVCAFNAGIAAGPWLGGVLLDRGMPVASIPLVSAALGGVALVVLAVDLAAGRRSRTGRAMLI